MTQTEWADPLALLALGSMLNTIYEYRKKNDRVKVLLGNSTKNSIFLKFLSNQPAFRKKIMGNDAQK